MFPAPVHCVKDKYITKINGKIIKPMYNTTEGREKSVENAASLNFRFNLNCFIPFSILSRGRRKHYIYSPMMAECTDVDLLINKNSRAFSMKASLNKKG